ncbi:MAG: hypothetical protein GX795_04325 [Firmicutes bacterium]|nr:hypothetical protein [Bacillota bacterium]
MRGYVMQRFSFMTAPDSGGSCQEGEEDSPACSGRAPYRNKPPDKQPAPNRCLLNHEEGLEGA